MGGWAQTARQYEYLSDALIAEFGGKAVVHICEQQGGLDSTFSQLDALELATSAGARLWIGCSLGGTILLEWLTQAVRRRDTGLSDCNDCVTLFGCNPHFVSNHHWPGVPDELLSDMSDSLPVNSRRTLRRFNQLQSTGLEPARQKHTVRWLNAELSSLSPEMLEEGLSLLRTLDARKALLSLTLPVLMLFGELDQLAGPGVQQSIAEAGLPLSHHTGQLPNTAHAVDETAGQLIAERIVTWLCGTN